MVSPSASIPDPGPMLLQTERLLLEPLTVAHAEQLFELLRDPVLYRYLDTPPPPTLEHLRGVYAKLETRRSPDGRERWLNWIVRPHRQAPVGYVQATVGGGRAWVAYVLGRDHWGHGYAGEATAAMLRHLAAAHAVTRCLATVEAENLRSIRVLQRLGFHPADAEALAGHDLSPTERLFVR
jgi:RimJ/RimL family protein N-acetyltransferase